ncbi:MAG: amidase family protein [Acidobacteriota bacterium]|nr:amidase family protein [Acidobacteriota bacterium]
MTIFEAAAQLRAKKISSTELVSTALSQISKLNPTLNAFITVLDERSREQARQADEDLARGIDRGPLHGIPVALKDVFPTKGVRTTCGSKIFERHVPDRDCAVAEKLAAAGSILIGKTGMHELAYGVTSNNPHFGTIRNPRNPDRIPGGSSGGSGAAVAADMAFMAMGSDTGGSIRIPAAYCGTVGLKPTSGRISRYGVMPLDFSLDHMGPLTRSIRDAAVTMNVLAGYDPRDDTSSRRPVEDYVPAEGCSIRGLRIGWPENYYFERVDPSVRAEVERMGALAESLGAAIVPVRVPDIPAINTVGRVILMSEASAFFDTLGASRDQFGPDVLSLYDQGRLLAATDYVNAQRLRRMMQREFAKLWDRIDCLFTPTVPIGAPPIGSLTVEIEGETEDTRLATTRFVRAINVLGLPALSIPCGVTDEQLPIGLQIVGKPFAEAEILRIGAALEDAV